MSDLLRQFIRASLQELRVDPHMMRMLKGTGLHGEVEGSVSDKEALAVANDWLEELKAETGEVTPYTRMRIRRYVTRKWPMLVKRFRGDKSAARQTLYNLLDTKSSEGEGR